MYCIEMLIVLQCIYETNDLLPPSYATLSFVLDQPCVIRVLASAGRHGQASLLPLHNVASLQCTYTRPSPLICYTADYFIRRHFSVILFEQEN